ncbi:CACTA en-spm transposon protein [Cucumis melo var. makuwa]|uniref:CACTA en-spm transposon protein n=1 Tax=Cucumis melo var. makuwa TaxID=1194695 RepID=A0A5D3DCK4_CUCMM|nr:CACTA en-spm transposon protein [Cucumis melo var. makuwa]TYK21401.1 CACTA en-spm transposon protein [Cucumis melo var. makuwa]
MRKERLLGSTLQQHHRCVNARYISNPSPKVADVPLEYIEVVKGGLRLSRINKAAKAKAAFNHSSRSKSFLQRQHELVEKLGQLVDCVDLFKERHTNRSGQFVSQTTANTHVIPDTVSFMHWELLSERRTPDGAFDVGRCLPDAIGEVCDVDGLEELCNYWFNWQELSNCCFAKVW